ncbi:uncharacterized protein LOC118756341, partial [Rhagoletis pomonella]|uniref:uncharacterized protein LOC118756341 n=1 Tax=Rhagoletis pomonella TaxID=28610 RepID=UPI00177D82C1
MALHRLRKLEARMAKDANYADSYKREIQKYVDKGYARLLNPDEVLLTTPTTWYLPHFGVVNPHKPGRLRVVFDAAAATSNVSLNSALLKGPEHAQSLLTIIFKFRQGVIAVAADVQEMFSQVAIKPDDQNSQRFLWRDGDPSKTIRTYVMSSLIFGAICSPCCAEYIKNINALKFESNMPGGSSAVINNMYVDDLVISFASAQEAEEVAKEAVAINSAAGFKVRKFVSNDKGLQAELNGENNFADSVVDMERKSIVDKVLGMYWNTLTDCFEFHTRFHKIARDVLDCTRPPTKRELLGIVMAIYDPFGFLANVTVCMKILLQSLWKRQVDWDEAIPNQLVVQWTSWWTSFQKVNKLSIPRCHSTMLPVADEVQLHVFVDASSSAYAAVAYLRICKGEDVDIAFVAAKSRCAPLKGMTIPRLELQAAVLGSRLQKSVVEYHDFNIHRIVLWSDSKTVLLWIRSTTREYKQFVAGRIAEIIPSTNPLQWRWLPSSLNVADDATRGQPMTESDARNRWFKGPTFLQLPESEWPKEVTPLTSTECAAEEKKILLLTSTTDEVTSWVLRFNFNARNRSRRSGELKAFEITDSEVFVCRRVQEEVFPNELEELLSKQKVSKSSPLYQLTPFLDIDGLIKVNGRIDAAYCLPLSARRPIIMPLRHHVTSLLVSYWHKKLHHQNDCLTINQIRQKFWVPHIRAVLTSVKKRCSVCIINTAKPSAPMMGQLPVDRLTPYVRPFSYTGVDYCGPFFVTIGRRREKRWVALFSCLTVRVIHLEVAEDLSTDAFIICIRNFINRRGTPVRMRSDNGTNFVGAQKLLRVEERLFDFNRIEQDCAER